MRFRGSTSVEIRMIHYGRKVTMGSGVTSAFTNAWLGGGESGASVPALDRIIEAADSRLLLDGHTHTLANERVAKLLAVDDVQ
jgi:hypothetical protein